MLYNLQVSYFGKKTAGCLRIEDFGYNSGGFTTRVTMKKTKNTKISNKIDDLSDCDE